MQIQAFVVKGSKREHRRLLSCVLLSRSSELVVSLGLGSYVHYPVMYGTADAVITNGYGRRDVGSRRPQLPCEQGLDHAEPRRDLLRLVPRDVRAAVAARNET